MPPMETFGDVGGRQSTYHRGNSHYHFEPDEIGEIILSDVMLYRPQVVPLMPNNVTFFKEEFLRQLKNDSGHISWPLWRSVQL
jgi:hypothetical protein